jgi:hypothetical protein
MKKEEKNVYLWKIEVMLKSGREIVGYDKNHFNNSIDLAKHIFSDDSSLISLGNNIGTKNLIIRVDEIASITISAG